jgi:nucleotide-binding universal stress UspA family protein
MIRPIKKILYATDLSKNSAYAYFYAADMARRRDAKIVILHAIEPLPQYVKAYYERLYDKNVTKVERDQEEEIVQEINKRLDDFCRKAEAHIGSPCADLVSKILVIRGNPVEEILRVAEVEGCDAIVLGNHGKGFLTQTFLGSVSRSVLDRTRKPVFIIPLPSEEVDLVWD